MKFSIKQLAAFIGLVALIIAYFLSTYANRKLVKENEDLRLMLGFTADTEYTLSHTVGGGDYAESGSFLLRINSPEKYRLEMIHYDGGTKSKIVKTIDLHDQLVAFTCIQAGETKEFVVKHTIPQTVPNKPLTYFYYRTDIVHPNLVCKPNGIPFQNPLLSYYFYPAGLIITGSPLTRTEAETISFCDQHKIQCVFFNIVSR